MRSTEHQFLNNNASLHGITQKCHRIRVLLENWDSLPPPIPGSPGSCIPVLLHVPNAEGCHWPFVQVIDDGPGNHRINQGSRAPY